MVLGLAFALVLVSYAVPHLWYSVGNAKFAVADGTTGTAKVYRSRNGEFLFSIKEQPEEIYLYIPATKQVGIPNGNQFTFIPLFAFSVTVPVPIVFSTNSRRVETDMNVIVEENKVQFTTLRGRRVEADLNDL